MNKNNKKPYFRKIALFIGSDVSSHLVMNKLIPQLLKYDYKPYVFFAKHKASVKSIPPEIQTLAFFERILINDFIYPYLDSKNEIAGTLYHSPNNLAKIYDITVKYIENVNDANFIKELEHNNINKGIVVRCYQKFIKKTIDYFNHRGFLWNLHPGILPEYRGVMTYFRSMVDGMQTAGYTLHEINEYWDAGAIIEVKPQNLDLSQAMLTNYCLIAPSAIDIIMNNLKKLGEGKKLNTYLQCEKKKRYFTFPTRQELDDFLSKGLTLVDPLFMKKFFLANYTKNSLSQEEMSKLIDDAIAKKLSQKTACKLNPNIA